MPTLPLAPSLLSLAPLGLVGLGMASWLDGDEEGESQPDEDEEFGMDDDFEVDDFDDDFGGMDEGSEASATELEGRIEELENEIANVSSTANTVRSENEQISEQVDEVQENVRKLLEIYEMVTRGVNPFVDEVSGDMGMGGDSGGFGLFDETEEESAEEADDLDEDLAGADAEDFFDDDAFDEIEEEDDLGGEFEDEMEDFDMEDEDTDEESGDGGTSFEELKEEYESGDADWAEEDLATEEEPEIEEEDDVGFEDDVAETEENQEDAELFDEEDLLEAESEEDAEEDAGETQEVETEGSPAAEMETTVDDENAETSAVGADESIGGFQFGTASRAKTDGPYLESPPNGYLADVVVLEWMDYLLSEFDARNTVRSINYYQRIGWIGQDMRDYLIQVLMGLTDSDYLYRDEFGTTELTMKDHMKSLEYIEELSTGNLDRKIADRLETISS